MAAELKTADEVRAHARAVQRRIDAQRRAGRVAAPPPPPALRRDEPRPPPAPPKRRREAVSDTSAFVRVVLQAAAARYLMPIDQITGASRELRVIEVRHLVTYVARRMGAYLASIAKTLHRDQTTVLHGCRAVRVRLEAGDRALIEAVDELGACAAAALQVTWTSVAPQEPVP